MRNVDVVVIGAGQAGLATSYWLTQRGIEHVVLERGQVGESWRSRRWDSFALNAPNWIFRLPGYSYRGPDPDAFMLKNELVAEFEGYAKLINAPVEAQTEVSRVSRNSDGKYLVATTGGGFTTGAVVAATGAYQRRNRPAGDLDPAILQLDTDQYRNPDELEPGGVLVVGSGQSGCQVAEDVLAAGRPTWLATSTCGWIPRRLRGHDNVYWRTEMGMFDDKAEDLGYALRVACPPIQTGVDRGRDVNLTTMRDAGATLVGRFEGAEGTRARFKDDLQSNATGSDKAALGLSARLNDFIEKNGIDAPEDPPIQPAGDFSGAPTELDLAENHITNVIWATGFRLDYSWIELDLGLTEQGYPTQTQGVSVQPGLYFMGLQLMHTRKSGLIFGVGEDAEHITGHIAGHLGAT